MARRICRFAATGSLTVVPLVASAGCSLISLDPFDRANCEGICDASVTVIVESGPDAPPDAPQMVVEGSSRDDDSETDAGPADSAVCMAGELTCSGSTPQQCVDGGWQSQTPCAGATPVCSNGMCGTYRTTGGIRSTTFPFPGDGGIRIVAGGFEIGRRTCNQAGLCVTGGIVP
jgi:hypothetical protein